MPDFLEWITIRLNQLGWTQRRLADEIELHEVTISYWRTGKHVPSPRSMQKVLDVIGEIPEEIMEEEELEVEEVEIVPENPDIGGITEHNPYDREDWPEGSGVYIFYDASERPVYVGQCQDIVTTLRDRYMHDNRGPHWIRRPLVQTLKFLPIGDERIRKGIETAMIKSMKKYLLFNTVHAR